jgi:C-terminal processing protease CtpA/Prc
MNKYSSPVLRFIFGSILLATSFVGCEKEDPLPPEPTETEIVNQFVFDVLSTYYLWDTFIPSGIDISTYSDPNLLFEDMKYDELDHWSAITDDYVAFQDALNGVRTTAGYKLKLFQIADSETVFGIIELVYSGGSADEAGLKRGDIMMKINGESLTTSNYVDLLGLEEYTIGLGQMVDDVLSETGETASIKKREMSINPILYYDVIDVEGTKIGYFVYDQFLDSYTTELKDVFSYFASQNITELVLDFRYNPGGYLSTCVDLAGMIVPEPALDKIFLSMEWNRQLTDYLTSKYGADSGYFKLFFSVPEVNLDLNRLVVLTSERTASASEAIINGLSPYMDVTVIGEQTVGKYTGASLFYDSEEQKHTWGIYLVINKIINVLGNTDYVDGFIPDFAVDDDYTTPLGDVNEPLLAKAIEYLVGVPVKKSVALPDNFQKLDNYYENNFEKNGLMITGKVKLNKHLK